MHLTNTAKAVPCEDTYLHIIFHYNPYYYKFKSDPQILNIVLGVYARIISDARDRYISGATVHSITMHSLWDIYNNNTIAYTTIYAQILGATSSFSW